MKVGAGQGAGDAVLAVGQSPGKQSSECRCGAIHEDAWAWQHRPQSRDSDPSRSLLPTPTSPAAGTSSTSSVFQALSWINRGLPQRGPLSGYEPGPSPSLVTGLPRRTLLPPGHHPASGPSSPQTSLQTHVAPDRITTSPAVQSVWTDGDGDGEGRSQHLTEEPDPAPGALPSAPRLPSLHCSGASVLWGEWRPSGRLGHLYRGGVFPVCPGQRGRQSQERPARPTFLLWVVPGSLSMSDLEGNGIEPVPPRNQGRRPLCHGRSCPIYYRLDAAVLASPSRAGGFRLRGRAAILSLPEKTHP